MDKACSGTMANGQRDGNRVRRKDLKRYTLLGGLITGWALLNPGSTVLAQSLPPVNLPQLNPGLVTPQEKDPILLRRERKSYIPINRPPVPQTPEVPKTPAAAPALPSMFTIDVKHINLEGNTVYSTTVLKTITTPFENKSLSIQELNGVAEKINQKYTDDSYVTTQVFIPPQNVENGEVTIRVLEGHVEDINVAGNKFYRASVIKGQSGTRPGDLFNLNTFEAGLKRMSETSPYHVQATLGTGQTPGSTDITLKVQETQPWQVSALMDNQGRPFIGSKRYGAELQNSSVFGFGDRFDVKWLASKRSNVTAASYAIPLNHTGTEIGYYYSFGFVHPDLDMANGDRLRGYAQNHTLSITQPLDKNRKWVADVALNARNVRSTVYRDFFNEDKVRSLTTGLSYSNYDRLGQTYVRVQNDVGMGLLGADRKFWKTQLFVNRMIKLPKNNFILLRASAQVTPDALPTVEETQIGGAFSVRGYSEGLLVGDRGYNASAEWRYPIPGLGHVSPWLAQRVQGSAFIDIGQVWLDSSNQLNNSDALNDIKKSNTLLGTGVGLRAQLTRFVAGFVDVGFGLAPQARSEPDAQPTARVHFGLRSDMLPKTYKTFDPKSLTEFHPAKNDPNFINASFSNPKVVAP